MIFAFSREPKENMKKADVNGSIEKKQTTDENKDEFEESLGELENKVLRETSKRFYATPKSYDFLTLWSYLLSLVYLIIVTFCYTIKNDGSTFDKFLVRFHYTF